MLIILAFIYSTNDSWYSDSNLRIRAENMLLPIVILISLLLAVYFISPVFQKGISITIGIIFKIIFFLIGVSTMLTTIFSYQKRKSYSS